MDEWTIKTPNRLFFKIDLLTDFAALCLTDFIDGRDIHLSLVFSTQLVNCCPHGWRTILVYCCPSTFFLTSPTPNPLSQTKCTVHRDSVWLWVGGGGGGGLDCVVDYILQEFYTLFLTRLRTYKIASPPRTKMTSKDDVWGLVSLKFLRPWCDGLLSRERGPAANNLEISYAR